MFFSWVLCIDRWGSDHSSRGVLPSVIEEPHSGSLGPLGLLSHEKNINELCVLLMECNYGFRLFLRKNSEYFPKQLWCDFVIMTQCSLWGRNWIPGVEWLTKCSVWTGEFRMSRLSTVENPVHPWPVLERSAVADGRSHAPLRLAEQVSININDRLLLSLMVVCRTVRCVKQMLWTFVSPRLRVSWYRQWLSNCGSRKYWMYSKLKENRPCTCKSKKAVAFEWSYYLNILNGRGNCIPLHLTFHLLLRINSNAFPTRS
jgi:hypothetical protein